MGFTREQLLKYIADQMNEKASAMSPEQRAFYAGLNKPQQEISDQDLEQVKAELESGKFRVPQKVRSIPSEFMAKDSDRAKANAVMDQYKAQPVLPQLSEPSQKDLDDSYNEFFAEEEKPKAPVRFNNLRQNLK